MMFCDYCTGRSIGPVLSSYARFELLRQKKAFIVGQLLKKMSLFIVDDLLKEILLASYFPPCSLGTDSLARFGKVCGTTPHPSPSKHSRQVPHMRKHCFVISIISIYFWSKCVPIFHLKPQICQSWSVSDYQIFFQAQWTPRTSCLRRT